MTSACITLAFKMPRLLFKILFSQLISQGAYEMNVDQIQYYTKKLSYEIDSADLYDKLNEADNSNIVVIDTRSKEAFVQEHIPTALNLHHKAMCHNNTTGLDKIKIYVCYCDGIGCNASTKGALKMLTLGFQVLELIGGITWWKKDGYETHGTKGQAALLIHCDC